MTSLAAGWRRVRLGDVAKEYSRRIDDPSSSGLDRFVGSNHIGRFELTVSNWGSTSDVTSAMKLFQRGDYLFVRRSLYASDFRERAARATFEGVCSGDILTIREKEGAVVDGFLSAVLNDPRIWEYVVAHATGSITRRIKWKQLREYEFALPPLEEQRRIVEVLQGVESCRQAHSSLRDCTSKCESAVVAGQVSELLSNRRVSELAEYADVTYGLTVNPARRQSADRLPYLRVANVLRGGFDLSEVKDIGTIDGDQGYALLSRDVLIVEGHADPSQIGRCAVWNGQIPQALHQNHLIRVRCSESLLPAYVSLLINSTHGQRYFRSHAKSSSGLSTINSTVVKRYSLPMPEIGVQRKLVMRAKLFSDARVSIQSREQALAGMQGALLRAIGGDQ